MKVAMLGTGAIAPVALAAMKAAAGISVEALWCRQRGETLAREYGIPRVYTDCRALFREGDVDTAYIALVNPVHFAYAREALLAGKNVILEKPFCTRWAQTRELADLAREKGLFLLEAARGPVPEDPGAGTGPGAHPAGPGKLFPVFQPV